MSSDLKHTRERLDEVDQQLIEALASRQQLIDEVAAAKADSGKDVQDPEREAEILDRLRRHAREAGLPPSLVSDLYERIFAHSVRHQVDHLLEAQNPERGAGTLTVAYQGSDGAYSHLAAKNHFGAYAEVLTCQGYSTFKEAVEAVEQGEARYAILPVENTTAGSINETYDLLAERQLHVVGEEVLPVRHCLMTLEPVPVRSLKHIYSHPQAIAQCSDFLADLDGPAPQTYLDTALAAKKVSEDGDSTQAAIASRQAAEHYGLHVLEENIANQSENYTRWMVVAREALQCDQRLPCKTSLLFSTRNEEGALVRCLGALAAHGINATKLESRPQRRHPWTYRFFLDIEGHAASEQVAAALDDLRPLTQHLRVLGTYPSPKTPEQAPRERNRAIEISSRKNDETAAAPEAAEAAASPEEATDSSASYRLAARSHRSEGTQIPVGDVVIGGEDPVLISGPCSVESEEQIQACAEAARQAGGHLLRGGCFKPRTSPYSFQGLGYDGLDLMEAAGRRYGLPIITEVLHPADVRRVARQADVLQIGARNMQNFPLLKAAGEADRPVMLKRGMMASIDEWLSAAEYILSHGNPRVMLCERGIRTFEEATRYTLDLSSVPVLRERTHLPIIVDPSHAAGKRRWVPDLVRAALAVGADGVMIEAHPHPEEARSDGPQSITFETLKDIGKLFQEK